MELSAGSAEWVPRVWAHLLDLHSSSRGRMASNLTVHADRGVKSHHKLVNLFLARVLLAVANAR